VNQFKKTGELSVIKNFIKKNDIVFDVGANVGNWSREVLKNHAVETLFMFEPEPISFATLTQNLCNVKKAHLFNMGVSNKQSMKEFFVYGNKNRTLSTFYRRSMEVEKRFSLQSKKSSDVLVVTLDEFCKTNHIHHINFLKIDTEGSEFDVIQGAIGMIENNKIDYIQFEYGACFLDAGVTLKMVYDFLSSCEYSILKVFPRRLETIDKFCETYEDYKLTNFLAIRKGL